jgi:hypothetical protein
MSARLELSDLTVDSFTTEESFADTLVMEEGTSYTEDHGTGCQMSWGAACSDDCIRESGDTQPDYCCG